MNAAWLLVLLTLPGQTEPHQAGDTLYAVPLRSAPARPIYTAISGPRFHDLAIAIDARDQRGIDDLIARKVVATIPPGTRFLVIDVDRLAEKPRMEVRFLDGPYAEKKGFLPLYSGDARPPRAVTTKSKTGKRKP
jgi:hypothetical protein